MIRTDLRLRVAALCAGIALTMQSHSAEPAGKGQTLFAQCAACHLGDGAGIPNMFPPLASRLGPLVKTPHGREYLILVVQNGLLGALQIDGVQYNGVMPAQGPGLGDEGIAAVLNYMLVQLNKETLPSGWKSFSAAEVAQVSARNPKPAPADLLQLRAKVFDAR